MSTTPTRLDAIPASFVVWQKDGVVYARNMTTGEIISDTDASEVINNALSSIDTLGGGGVFLKRGTFTLTNPLKVGDFTILEGEGNATELKAETNMNDHLIENLDQTNGNWGSIIRDLYLNGNADNQDGAGPYNGIYWKNPTSNHPWTDWTAGETPNALALENLVIWNCKGDGVRLDGTDGSLMAQCRNLHIRYGSSTYYGMNIISVSDSFFEDLVLVGNAGGLLVNGGGGNQFNNIYVAGAADIEDSSGIILYWCQRMIFTNLRVDHCARDGVMIVSSLRNVIIGGTVTDCGYAADNTYDGFKLSGGANECIDNIISGFYFGRWSETNRLMYGVEETSSDVDYNLYHNLNGRDCGTGVLRFLGTNGSYDTDTMLGTVVTV